MDVFQIQLVRCSGLEWFSSFGSFLDDPDHPWTQFWFFGPPPWRQGPMNSGLSVRPCVRDALFSELALRIYLKLCMKVGGYKGSKVTESDFSAKLWNSRSGVISAEKCWKMDSFRIFFKTALRSKDFAIIGNLDAPDGCLSDSSGPVFWETLDLELRMISGWSRSSLD